MAEWLEGPGQYAVGLSIWSGWSWDLVVESDRHGDPIVETLEVIPLQQEAGWWDSQSV